MSGVEAIIALAAGLPIAQTVAQEAWVQPFVRAYSTYQKIRSLYDEYKEASDKRRELIEKTGILMGAVEDLFHALRRRGEEAPSESVKVSGERLALVLDRTLATCLKQRKRVLVLRVWKRKSDLAAVVALNKDMDEVRSVFSDAVVVRHYAEHVEQRTRDEQRRVTRLDKLIELKKRHIREQEGRGKDAGDLRRQLRELEEAKSEAY